MPPINAIFAMFEPIITPRVRFDAFSKAEVIATESSGKDVPMAKIKADMTKDFLDVSRLSRLTATITKSALLIKTNERNIIEIIILATIYVSISGFNFFRKINFEISIITNITADAANTLNHCIGFNFVSPQKFLNSPVVKGNIWKHNPAIDAAFSHLFLNGFSSQKGAVSVLTENTYTKEFTPRVANAIDLPTLMSPDDSK